MMIYVAGPYSASSEYTVAQNIEEAKKISAELWAKGHGVLCPHMNTAFFENEAPDVSYEHYMAGDFMFIRRSDALVMTPRWKESKGAVREHEYAQSLGMPIYYYPDVPDLHLTEIRCPEQAVAFSETIGKMYRVHLDKNADYCLAPGTRVLNGKLRWVPVETLSAGETIVGFDEQVLYRRMYRPSEVLSMRPVRLESYKITLETGETFVASGEHPWLVADGLTTTWLRTDALKPGSSCLIKALDTWEPDTSYEAGFMSAALDGEGWLSQQTPTGKNRHKHGKGFVLGFAQRDNAMLAKVKSILTSWGLSFYEKRYRKDLVQLIFGKPRRDVIKMLGMIRPPRLLHNLTLELGMVDLRRRIKVVSVEPVGEQDLIALTTSTKTFLANGYATHNSPANILLTGNVGAAVRIWDKTARILNLLGFDLKVDVGDFSSARTPKNESLQDAFLDLAVYAIIGWLLLKRKWGK